MRSSNKSRVSIFAPFLLAFGSARFKSVWLVLATVILIFILVSVLPFCRKRENLWLFIFCAVCSIPINYFLLTEFPQWKYLIYSGKISYYMTLIEMILILTGVEEVVVVIIGCRIWKRQYALYIPVGKDEEE